MKDKNFDDWNEMKKNIDGVLPSFFPHERELWWCILGINIGYEQDGAGNEYQRPILILKKFSGNICLVIPLTTSKQTHQFRPSVGLVEGIENRALLNQLRVVDTKRLIKKIGYIDRGIFESIRKTTKEIL